MFSFSVDVFINTPQSVQAHLRRHTPAPTAENPQATKGDEKPFALFNVHFGQGATADNAEAMILLYDEAVCPQSNLGELSSKLNDIIVNHMKKKLVGILFLSRLEPTLANEGPPPKGFGISRTADSGASQRYVLMEADEKGPIAKDPSALIDVFFPAADQISMTLLTMDKRLYGEQAARGLLGWFVQQMKMEARPKTNVEWHNARFLGFARPAQPGEQPPAPAPTFNA